jgi:hypothetical protein
MSKVTDAISDIAEIDNKQDLLVSGTNIKTVNGSSVLGSGDLDLGAYSIGDILYTKSNETPNGFIKADGSVYFQSTYPDLFSVVGLLPTVSECTVWTYRDSPSFTSSIPLYGFAYGNNVYVAVGSGVIYSSTNLGTWTSRSHGFGGADIKGVYFIDGAFLACGESSIMARSTDGITWSNVTASVSGVQSIAYGNGKYIGVSNTTSIATSTNGTSWTATSNVFTVGKKKIIFNNGLFLTVGTGTNIMTSTDGVTWTSRSSGLPSGDIYSIAYGNGKYVAVANTGNITTSADGVTWTANTNRVFNGSGNTMFDIIFANGLFLAGGGGGIVAKSRNGTHWLVETSTHGTTRTVNTVYFGGGYYFLGSSAGTIFTATQSYNTTTQFAVPFESGDVYSSSTAYIKCF